MVKSVPAIKNAKAHASARDLARLFFFLVVTLGTIFVFALTPNLMPSAMISLLLYFILGPVIDAFERRGVSRTIGIIALFAVIGSITALSVSSIVPKITEEMQVLQKDNSRYLTNVTKKLQEQERRLLGSHPIFKTANLTKKAVNWLQTSTDKLWSVVPDLASQTLTLLFLVPFLTFVLLKDGREMQRALLRLVPNPYFETAYSLLFKIMDGMGGFVAARIIEAILVALLVGIGCGAVGIPYGILLGIFAGATNPIPYLGPAIGAVPGIILAVLDPSVPNQLFWVTMIYVAANIIDMVVIFPVVVAKIVDLHPVVVVISVILGSQLFGIIGMVLAVPLTSILKIFIQEIHSKLYDRGHVSLFKIK